MFYFGERFVLTKRSSNLEFMTKFNTIKSRSILWLFYHLNHIA